ncbi:MAG: hypothetical protein JWP22_1574 [Ramlibacter sp.]|nr:hypothetical protein [Ramlibacter sp.]
MENNGLTIPVSLMRREERRRADRFVAAMPVTVDGREATTGDLSSTGLSFVADRAYEIGSSIDVVIEYLLDGAHYPLHCKAEVVHADPCEGGFRMGARLAPDSSAHEIEVQGAQGDQQEGAARQRLRLRSVD